MFLSSSTGAARLGAHFLDISAGAAAGVESANIGQSGGRREAGDLNDGDTGCAARALQDRSNMFGARHRQESRNGFRMRDGKSGSIRRVVA